MQCKHRPTDQTPLLCQQKFIAPVRPCLWRFAAQYVTCLFAAAPKDRRLGAGLPPSSLGRWHCFARQPVCRCCLLLLLLPRCCCCSLLLHLHIFLVPRSQQRCAAAQPKQACARFDGTTAGLQDGASLGKHHDTSRHDSPDDRARGRGCHVLGHHEQQAAPLKSGFAVGLYDRCRTLVKGLGAIR